MKIYIDELVLTSDNLSEEHGLFYESLGFDVIYDTHFIKIYSSQVSKIVSINEGIHVHTILSGTDNILFDNMGNKILVKYLNKKSHVSVGIITSGGDAPGMNSCIRSIVRSSIKYGGSVYGVYRGYDGLINDYICELGWDTETHSSAEGGTVLLSFRSKEFFSREGRKKAVFNLIKRGINSLIILGGDGSLKGGLILKNEFKELFKELIEEGKISIEDIYFNEKSNHNNEMYNNNEMNNDTSNCKIDHKYNINNFNNNFNNDMNINNCHNNINNDMNINNFNNNLNNDMNITNFKNNLNNDMNINNTSIYNNNEEYYNNFYGIPECYKENPKKNINRNKINENSINSIILNKKNIQDNLIYDLNIVGIPASIDNDISSCDYTLGCDTALNRIVESIDHLSSTMRSHQRVFVIEVMGRTCGWLGLMSGYSCLADYIFIPEDPPLDWKKEVLENIKYGRKHGKPGIFIIISEGAVDSSGNKIESSSVVSHIKEEGIDVRLLKLGHVQRGGPTSSFDRILGTLSGIKAYEEIIKNINDNYNNININDNYNNININEDNNYNKDNLIDQDEKDNQDNKNDQVNNNDKIIVYDNGDIISLNLKDVIDQNDKIKEYENIKDYKSILENRGNLFRSAHSLYRNLINGKKDSLAMCMEDINLRVLLQENVSLKNKYKEENTSLKNKFKNINTKRIGIIQYGVRSSGMNTALNSIVQYCYMRQVEPFYILNGLEGFFNDQVVKAEIYEFGNDFNNGGSILGMGNNINDLYNNNDSYNNNDLYNKGVIDNNINNDSYNKGVIDNDINNDDIVHNNYSQTILNQMKKFNLSSLIIIGDSSGLEFISDISLPYPYSIILIPAASSNNIPSTDISIGTDTALNTILKVADCAKLTSLSLKKNVFVLEISGGHCGYLTMMASIAAGAFDSFIPERKYLISHLSDTAHRLRIRFRDNKRTGTVIFRNEKTFCSISTESFCRLLKTDGMNLFSTDYSVLGILQQGINPSPLDRIHATLMGFKGVDFCIENKGIGIVGIQGSKIVFTEINECIKLYNKNKKRVKNAKWIKYSKVCKSLE